MPLRRGPFVLAALYLLAATSAPAEPARRGPRLAPAPRLPSGPLAVAHLLARYRATADSLGLRATRVRFEGVGRKDVYNPTRPFVIGERTVLAARVESRDSETDSRVCFFEKRGHAWHLVASAPRLRLQDPFVSQIGGQLVLGGVRVSRRDDGSIAYRTVFYRGSTLDRLRPFAAGPWGMKDIRLADLGGRILLLTRPQGARGGRGKIGYAILRSLKELTPERIEKAPLIEGQFRDDEWGGANEIHVLGANKVGVLGHVARFDKHGNRDYFPIAFEIDLSRQVVSAHRILAERADLPRGTRGPSKRNDLRNVLFSGGLQRDGKGRARLWVGAGDAEVMVINRRDPFLASRRGALAIAARPLAPSPASLLLSRQPGK